MPRLLRNDFLILHRPVPAGKWDQGRSHGATFGPFWSGMPAGRHALDWDSRDANGSPVRPGAYLYRITAGPFHARKKLVVLP